LTNNNHKDDRTTIPLVRHGRTEWNELGKWQGHTDIPLNETGRQQARALARRLATWPIQAIYSSDLLRAAETAEIIGQLHDLSPIQEYDLRERYGGFFEGLDGEQIRSNHSAEWEALVMGQELDGVEGNTAVQDRMWQFFEKVAAAHPGEMVVMVSHGASLGMLLAKALGFTAAQRPRFTMRQNTGLSIVEVNEEGPLVTLLNDASHLAD
jgi:broad specificity phosphatase PhoE